MNIGIDIDGVLTDIQGFNRRHAPRFFKRKFGRDVIDENPYDIRDIFQCPENEYMAYWKRYLFKYVITEPARKSAMSVIHKLRSDGHKVYIISKRVFTCQNNFMGKLMRFIVRIWLWRNGIRYNEIVFCDNDVPDSKRIACLEKNIDLMIDDEIVNIEAIMPIAKVICFDVSYNRKCEGKNIFRAYDWNEVYKLIFQINRVDLSQHII
ncbi:MAG: hypothetical protein FWD90_02585 [Defluviitaleaceae bacterium]|nr:hypothetical protein [Defluviitaleaceae bacterium]